MRKLAGALKQAFGGENPRLKELDQEILRKEKEIQQCEKVLEVMASQARIQIMTNPELVNDILARTAFSLYAVARIN